MKLKINSVFEIGDKKYRLTEDLELIEITKSIYELKEGDKYNYINECGVINYTFSVNDNYDNRLLKNGNAFLTEEEAFFELERRKIIAKIKKWKYENDDYEFTYGNENYYIYYKYYNHCFDTTNFYKKFQSLPSWQYFSSKEKARECLNFIGEENWKKYVLEIK